ncbi:MAG: DUF4337 domain-containing protein [Alphaproteobacteria bacterium]|nr:DUF4337 domain-containing protein [Alphaproteobacteria bacterium]
MTEVAHQSHELAERISEANEEHKVSEEHKDRRFRRGAAIFIGVLAMLLAITSLGGENATKEMLNANIHASDTYAFYQARNLRQTATQLALEQLETLLLAEPPPGAAQQAALEKRIGEYKERIARFESDPVGGEGKRELLRKAQGFEAARDRAQRQAPNFEFAQAFFQIAIVLGSVSIVAASAPLLGLSAVLATLACALSINGYFLIVELPIG